MSWIRLDEALLQDDWYIDLPCDQARAWLHFILYSGHAGKGVVPVMSLKLLSAHIFCDQGSVEEMLQSAILNGKVTVCNNNGKTVTASNSDNRYETECDFWVVTAFQKYNPDPTNSERQARHREKKKQEKQEDSKEVTASNSDVTQVTPTATATATATATVRDEKQKKECVPPYPPNVNNSVDNSKPPERCLKSSSSQKKVADIVNDLAESKTPDYGKVKESRASDIVYLTNELCGVLHIKKDQDRSVIFAAVAKALASVGDQPIHKIISEVRQGIQERRLTNPIGVAMAALYKLAPKPGARINPG